MIPSCVQRHAQRSAYHVMCVLTCPSVGRVMLTKSRVSGGVQTADGDGNSCVLDLLSLGEEGPGSCVDLSGILKMTLLMCGS